MGAPVENETVFVRIVGRTVCEARVVHLALTSGKFGVWAIGGGYTSWHIDDEGITWARPEHVAALRVTVALSP